MQSQAFASPVDYRARPDYAPAYGSRGYIYNKLELYDNALVDLERAIQLEPNCAPNHVNIAHSLVHSDRLSAALAHLQRAIGQTAEGTQEPDIKKLRISLLELGIRSGLVFATSGAKLPDNLCLRHSCATLLLQAGVHPKIVSERLGHASIVLTLDTYSHVLPTMQDEATM